MRISVFIDGANFFYMQKDGLGWFVDPKKLLDYLGSKGEVVDAYYYIGVDSSPEVKHEAFLKALPLMGYSLVTKQIKSLYSDKGIIRRKANLDIEIVLDMFNTIDHYDMAVLVSGDGDFERPLQLLRARGKKFKVLATHSFIAREILELSGRHYIDFNEIRDYVEKTTTPSPAYRGNEDYDDEE